MGKGISWNPESFNTFPGYVHDHLEFQKGLLFRQPGPRESKLSEVAAIVKKAFEEPARVLGDSKGQLLQRAHLLLHIPKLNEEIDVYNKAVENDIWITILHVILLIVTIGIFSFKDAMKIETLTPQLDKLMDVATKAKAQKYLRSVLTLEDLFKLPLNQRQEIARMLDLEKGYGEKEAKLNEIKKEPTLCYFLPALKQPLTVLEEEYKGPDMIDAGLLCHTDKAAFQSQVVKAWSVHEICAFFGGDEGDKLWQFVFGDLEEPQKFFDEFSTDKVNGLIESAVSDPSLNFVRALDSDGNPIFFSILSDYDWDNLTPGTWPLLADLKTAKGVKFDNLLLSEEEILKKTITLSLKNGSVDLFLSTFAEEGGKDLWKQFSGELTRKDCIKVPSEAMSKLVCGIHNSEKLGFIELSEQLEFLSKEHWKGMTREAVEIVQGLRDSIDFDDLAITKEEFDELCAVRGFGDEDTLIKNLAQMDVEAVTAYLLNRDNIGKMPRLIAKILETRLPVAAPLFIDTKSPNSQIVFKIFIGASPFDFNIDPIQGESVSAKFYAALSDEQKQWYDAFRRERLSEKSGNNDDSFSQSSLDSFLDFESIPEGDSGQSWPEIDRSLLEKLSTMEEGELTHFVSNPQYIGCMPNLVAKALEERTADVAKVLNCKPSEITSEAVFKQFAREKFDLGESAPDRSKERLGNRFYAALSDQQKEWYDEVKQSALGSTHSSSGGEEDEGNLSLLFK